jgi:hypothetical protein
MNERDFVFYCLLVPTGIIMWTMASVVVLAAIGLVLGEKKPEVKRPCPHGFDNWDDCPDCCH